MDRNIYKWHDGTKPRASDPAILRRRFHQALKTFDLDMGRIRADVAVAQMTHDLVSHSTDEEQKRKQIQQDIANGYESSGDLARIAYFMFDVKPLADDESGLTEDEATKLLNDFFSWESELLGEPNGLPTSPASTEPQASNSPGGKSTDSISTSTTSPSGAQPSMPLGRPAPAIQQAGY